MIGRPTVELTPLRLGGHHQCSDGRGTGAWTASDPQPLKGKSMRTDPASRPTVRAARWSATHPWRAVALWMVFVAACIAVGNAAGLRDLSDVQAGIGQSGQATRWIHDADLEGLDQEN